MKKLYCDRCGCETKKLFETNIPDKIISRDSFLNKTIELCSGCYEYITTSVKRYNELCVHQRIAFFNTLMLTPPDKGGEE